MSAAAPDRLEFRHAIRDALAEELERDERVVFFGEDVAAPPSDVAEPAPIWFGKSRIPTSITATV